MIIIDLQNANQKKTIETAVKVLQAGGLIIYPTETCYGLGVDASNKTAVKKLLKFLLRRNKTCV